MMSWITPLRLRSSFLREYAAAGRPAARLERVLAVGRAFLTVTGLVAIYLDPTEPSRFAAATYAVLMTYAAYSLIVLALVRSANRIAPAHAILLHAGDILWTSALTFISEGPMSPFFLFFLFVVLAAAYRWGFRETLATAVITATVFLLESAVAANGPWSRTWFDSISFELNRAILRVAYLLLTGFLLGYLAEQEKQSRGELAAMAAAARQLRVDIGLGGSVTAVSESLLHTFRASSVAIVLQQHETRQTMLWRLDGGGRLGADPGTLSLELNPAQRADWLFAAPGRAWHAARTRDDVVFRVTEPEAWRLARARAELPDTVEQSRPFTTLTAVDMGLADEWSGRIYLFDIAPYGSLERRVHFLEALTDHITPGLTNVLLLRRLRSQATATERARVARELHDGAIQSLFGIEMKIEALRRTAKAWPAEAGADLEAIQSLLRQEVLSLRELMQAIRPIELDAGDHLGDVLPSVVERFRRDTSIPARFVAVGGQVALHRSTTLELVRIVQEALVNVRKHSRAGHVLVRLTRQPLGCELIVEDDGRGFDFEGHVSAAELDRRRIGPAIIKERARTIGAALAVDSRPGVGSRIELTFAEDARE